MTPLLLWLLATVDGAFAGYRAAAGRIMLIDKRAWYRQAMLHGALGVQVAVAIACLSLGLALALSAEPQALLVDAVAAEERALVVYAPYAGLIALGLTLRAVPSVDVRSATSVVLFGPLTLLRPLVVLAGGACAAVSASPPVLALIVLVLAMMLAFGPILDRVVSRRATRTRGPEQAGRA
jgi:hypothetical protein